MEPQEPLKTTPPDTQNLNTDDRSLQKSDGSEPEGVYVVEEILGKRVINEQKFYLVHWKNYPEVQSTWEPIENLLNALDLVIEFEVRECLKECNQDSKDNEEDNDPLSQLKFQIPFNFTTENDVFIRLRTSDINPGYIGPVAMQIPRENGVTPMETSPTPKKKKKRMRQDSEHHIEVGPKEEKIKHKLKKVKITSSSNSFGGGKIIKLKRLQTTSLENITISTTEGIKKKRGRPPKSAQKDSSIILSQKSKEQIMISVEKAKSDGLKGLKGIKGMKGIKKYKKKDKAKSEEKIVDKGPEKAELVIKRPRGRPKLIKPTPSSIEKREVEISPEKSNSVIIPKKRGRPFKIKKDMTSSMEKKGDEETKILKTDKNKTVVISKSMGDLDSGRSSSTKILLALKPTPGKKGKSKDKIKMEVSISPEKGGKNVSPEKGPDGLVKRKRGRPPGKKNANKEVEKEKEKEKIVIHPVSISMPSLPQKKLVKSLNSSSIELNRDALKDKSGVPALVPKKRGRPPKYLKETSAKGKMEVEEKPEKVKSKMSVSQPKSTARSGMEVESSTDR